MNEAALAWRHTQTDRGFVLIEFADEYGKACSLQESSLATRDCIWFGVDDDGQRMHLTQEHVKALMPYLQRFVDSGALPPPGEDLKAPYGDGAITPERLQRGIADTHAGRILTHEQMWNSDDQL